VILSRRSSHPPRNRGAGPLRGLAVLAAAAVVPAVAGCEAGLNAPTQNWHQPTAGATAVVHKTIRVNNMFVLGAPPGSSLAAGSSAGLFVALANSGSPDRLIGISAPGVAGSVLGPTGGISLGRGQSVLLTGPEPRIVLENLTHSLGGGQFIKVTLDFQNAGTKTLSVPVMPRAQFYSTFSPAPVSPSPLPSLTPNPSAKSHKKPKPTPTPVPAAS
jgi:copper(I)-binding protein